MDNREKLEIPTIAFTEVTMLYTASSTCSAEKCKKYDPNLPLIMGNNNIEGDTGGV